MKCREWTIADLRRAKKADLDRYLSMAAEDGYVIKNAPKNNSARIAELRGLRCLFWEDQQKEREKRFNAAMKLCAAAPASEPTQKITAREANAFLRSLPPHQHET